jgi:GNAT superfamily N-acetyltransferase
MSDDVLEKLGSVSLEYSWSQDLDSEAPAVQQWWVSAVYSDWETTDERGEPAEETVARMNIVKGALGGDLFDQLDSIEQDLETVGSAVLDPETGELREAVPQSGFGPSLVILNSVELADAWRGRGIGAFLAGVALQALSGDAACIATFPAPLDDSKGEARQRAIRRLEQVWAQLGFEHYRAGVWVLDPALVALDNAVRSMRERFGFAPR